MSSAKRISFPYGGRYCCVVGCNNSQYRDIPRGVKFHSFPKDEDRKRQWVVAVNRVDPKKRFSLWHPKPSDVICSEHFVGGKKSDDKNSSSYVPFIFPTTTRHAKVHYADDTPRALRRQRLLAIKDREVNFSQYMMKGFLVQDREGGG